jgi:hypothetical protein
MSEWWESFDEGFRSWRIFLVTALAGGTVFFLLSASPAAGESKGSGGVKDLTVRSMVDAAEYLCRKKCTQEHGQESPEFLVCLNRCRGEKTDEITGAYAMNGSRSSGDCPDYGPTVSSTGVLVKAAGGTVTFFSSAEISAPLNADGSFRGEGTYISGDRTIREIIEGVFAKDPRGMIIFIGTRSFENLTNGCTVAYSVTYAMLQEK